MTDLIELESRPETLDEFASLYFETVREMSETIHRKFGTVEAEDIEQGVWEAVVQSFDKAFTGLARDTARARLYRVGMRYQNREDLDYMYFAGNYHYSPSEVRLKLATCAWSDVEKCPDIDAKIDLRAAFTALPPKQRMAVFKRFGMRVLAGELSSSEKRSEERGVDGITNWLNRKEKRAAVRLDDEEGLAAVEEFLTESVHGSEYGGEYR